MSKKSKTRGLTLIELLVVIAVTAIILTIGVPSFKTMFAKNRLKGAAEGLYADFQYARLEAIKQNRNVTLHFAGTGGPPWTTWCYGIDDTGADCDCTDNDPACTVQGVQRIINNTDFKGVTLTTNFGGDDTGFEPVRGIAQDNGTTTFASSSNSDAVKIVLSTFGRVRICSDDLWDYENC